MGYTVDVDIGGTFTDFFAAKNSVEVITTKSPTTHYDLSVGFLRGLKDLAKGLVTVGVTSGHPAPAPPVGPDIKSDTRIFSRNSMKGF